MKKKRLWEVLRESGIKERSKLTKVIRLIRNDKCLSLKEKDEEEWALILQFSNNNGYL